MRASNGWGSRSSLHDTDWKRNGLVAAVPAGCRERWRAEGQPVLLQAGETLHDPGSAPPFVWFPIDMTVSLLSVLSTGTSLKAAIVGPEGLVGVSTILSNGAADTRAVVQSGGIAVRVPAEGVRREFDADPAVRRPLLRFTQALLVQIAQAALCNRYHRPDQQLCRWLLQGLDRVPAAEVAITHEAIAAMLGVRRETVTEACRRLHERGLINSHRGRLEVVDRDGLERDVCECYWAVREKYQRLLSRRLA